MKQLTHGSLFSGIGGFDLAAEKMNWQNVFHCENNPFGQKILKHYWPNSISYDDIKQTNFTIHANKITVLTGGFPCQPYSFAGKRQGTNDERHLWPQMLRAISEIKPKWIVAENVPGIVNWNNGTVFEEIQSDLENQGYEVLPLLLPALPFGVNHIRQRTWFIAYANGLRWQNLQSNIAGLKNPTINPKRGGEETKQGIEKTIGLDPFSNAFLQFEQMHGKPPVFAEHDELPFKLDGITVPKWIVESLKGAGNAILPNVAIQLFKIIELFEQQENR